jgi:hypothetical protein
MECDSIYGPMRQITTPPRLFSSHPLAAILVLIALCGLGCSRAGRPFDPTELTTRDDIRLVRLNHIGQRGRADCGVGALAMVYAYWGDPAGYETILADLTAGAGAGEAVVAGDLKQHALDRGYHAFIVAMNAGEIRKQIDRGRPVIVCRPVLRDLNHYEVVFGYDRTNGDVFLDDPVRGKLRRSEAAFRCQHEKTDRFALLIVPK